jgi:hypothetical protein
MQNPDRLENADAKVAGESSVLRYAALLMWPSFLAACLLEVLIFSMVDPREIHWPSQMSEPSRQSVYSVSFFLFWLITISCSGLVLWLAKSERSLNEEAISDKPAD